ncbi:ribbon-helix-helix domain-containing protein [bacterium]|nr:ribbon-helix-helix domain-containing protein [bacterium]
MARKKISTTVYLTERQVEALKELHQRTRVPVAEYIRMGIDLVLKNHEEALPGQMSLFESLEVEQDQAKDSEDS